MPPVGEIAEEGQGSQWAEPEFAEYVPASHAVQLVAPVTAEYVPASHAVHVASLVAPVTVEYVPASHAVQLAPLVAPVTVEYVPASHAVQLVAPEDPPLGVGAYVPALQSLHVSPSMRYWPAPHWRQSWRTDPPPLLSNI